MKRQWVPYPESWEDVHIPEPEPQLDLFSKKPPCNPDDAGAYYPSDEVE